MKNILIILSLTGLVFYSCEETTIIDVDQAPSRVVIDAILTDRPDDQRVKITRSLDFYAQGFSPALSNASVTVSDDLGTTFNFIESEDEPGLYLPAIPFLGVVGRTYTLQVDVDGSTYISTETMMSVTPIDSLNSQLNMDEQEDPESPGRIYEVLMYTVEPQDEENFYLFKFYRNGDIQNENGEDITVTNDVGVDEEIQGIEAPLFYALNDTATVEMYSLTRRSFIYWSDVANLVFSDGGVFSPLPANPRSNIEGGALGIFQVSSVSTESIVVQ